MGEKVIPEFHNVDSSAVCLYGYDEEHWRLYVEFATGQKYTYLDVAPEIIVDWLDAPSKGKFFNRVIKPMHMHDEGWNYYEVAKGCTLLQQRQRDAAQAD